MTSAVVITVSTRAAAGQYPDESGPVVAQILRDAGFEVGEVVVVPDGRAPVADAIRSASADARLVVTTGGTGLARSDVTPEATAEVVDRLVPGIGELMRTRSLAITPMAALSRATAGTLGSTLVVNLPGSPKAARENLDAVLGVLGHALDQLGGGDHAR